MSPDVLVIGGGIVGAASAYHLARAGASVTLLEANDLAYGATGRNLGYIWVHTRRPGPELELVMHLRRELEELPGVFDDDFGLRTEGGLIYVHTEEQLTTLRAFVERRQADGVDIRLIDGDEARALAPILPDTVIGASFCPLDAQMDSGRYVRAFATAASRLGARILEQTPVRSLEREGSRIVRVTTDTGTFTPGRVVVAAGAWTAGLLRQIGADVPIHAMRLQIVQTTPMARTLGPVLYGPAAVKQYLIFRELPSFRREHWANEAEDRHGKALLEAVCQRDDGSYLLGCAMDYPGEVWEPDLSGVALVAESLPAIMPALRGASFARAWAGVLPYTADNLPIVDALPGFDDAYIAAGHVFGNGAGPTTGRLVADLICGGAPIMDMAPFRADRPGLAESAAGSVW
ncbi:MAG TPA: FAD-binding oxidoreductase [Candidatus Limnocylindrales bacterium]|jgi:glycine/D-amino acid oxidase-like deaminating enzyme|nr:FAD-binding oxidoreductase [Candidatus Limnocylindrales bacterium]